MEITNNKITPHSIFEIVARDSTHKEGAHTTSHIYIYKWQRHIQTTIRHHQISKNEEGLLYPATAKALALAAAKIYLIF